MSCTFMNHVNVDISDLNVIKLVFTKKDAIDTDLELYLLAMLISFWRLSSQTLSRFAD